MPMTPPSAKRPPDHAAANESLVPAMLRVSREGVLIGIEDHLGKDLGLPLTVHTSLSGGVVAEINGSFFPAVHKSDVVIVVLGSSNGAGMGASGYTGDPTEANGWSSPQTSWAGLLQAALGIGFKVINVSKSGTGVANSLSRFWTDVAVHNPDFVIVCNHFQNDSYSFDTTYRATMGLCKLCDRIGAVPILRGAYVSNTMTAKQYRDSLALNRALDASGRWRIDHMSVFDDGAGHFVSSAYHVGDGLHPNDAGYAQLFRSIDLGIFTIGVGPMRPTLVRKNKEGAGWRINGPTPVNGPGIVIGGLAQGLYSWTLRARIKVDSTTTPLGRCFLSAYTPARGSSNSMRIRNPSAFFTLTDGASDVGVSDVPTNTPGWHDIAMIYSRPRNVLSLCVDGVVKVEGAATSNDVDGIFSTFVIAATNTSADTAAAGFVFSDVALWNVPLGSEQIKSLFLGDVPTAGLLYFSALSYTPPGSGISAVLPNESASPAPRAISPAFAFYPHTDI